MVAQVVDANYITASASSSQAFKTATLLKTLSVNALIRGESGVGKSSLARFILPDAPVLDASHYDELLLALESTSQVIIINLENSPNIKRILEFVVAHNIRIVATAAHLYNHEMIDKVFSIKLDIPSLKERPEDVVLLMQKFIKEASSLFGPIETLKINEIKPDLRKNSHSLRKQIMIHYLLQNINERELMEIIENYLFDKIGSNSDYKNFLHLYEVPLINSGLRKFKSQLQLSDKLGLNRNTLRKKIADNEKYFKG